MKQEIKDVSEFDHNERYRDYFRLEVIPKYYHGAVHVLLNLFLLLSPLLFALKKIERPSTFELLVLPLMLILGNIAVYFIHKYALHRPFKLFPYPYNVHSRMHHQFFTDKHIVYDGLRDFYILFFPPEVVISFVFIYCPLTFILLASFFSLNVAYLSIFGAAIYFLLYEIFHYISHLPKEHLILKIPICFFIREHHRIHHDPTLMRDYNFNIVFPFCDFLFKTLHKVPKGDH